MLFYPICRKRIKAGSRYTSAACSHNEGLQASHAGTFGIKTKTDPRVCTTCILSLYSVVPETAVAGRYPPDSDDVKHHQALLSRNLIYPFASPGRGYLRKFPMIIRERCDS